MPSIPFIPREEKFFDLFERAAHNIVKAALGLKEMLDNWENVGIKVAEITELEHEGDAITHQIAALLHRTFVTPFDREDIATLAHTMDDIIDFIHAAADARVVVPLRAGARSLNLSVTAGIALWEGLRQTGQVG